MRHVIQTLAMSAAFTAAGTLAVEAVADYARKAEQRQSIHLPQGNPGIPDSVRASLRSSFGGN